MASPLTVARNDYHRNKKPSTIYTLVGVAQFLFDILQSGHRCSLDQYVRTDVMSYERPDGWFGKNGGLEFLLDVNVGLGYLEKT